MKIFLTVMNFAVIVLMLGSLTLEIFYSEVDFDNDTFGYLAIKVIVMVILCYAMVLAAASTAQLYR